MKHFDFGTGSFTVLAPNGISQNSNDNSLVIKLENGSNSFIFTGDAEETSEQDMISTGMNLDCDVLSVGHHGLQVQLPGISLRRLLHLTQS